MFKNGQKGDTANLVLSQLRTFSDNKCPCLGVMGVVKRGQCHLFYRRAYYSHRQHRSVTFQMFYFDLKFPCIIIMFQVVGSVVTAIGGYYGPDDSRVFPKVYSIYLNSICGAYNTLSPTVGMCVNKQPNDAALSKTAPQAPA